jgi:hypothetical protein
MRRAALVPAVALAAVLTSGLAAGSAHAAPTLNYGCSPPTVPTQASCAAWHTQPVRLIWDWDALTAQPVGGDCSPQLFSQDNPALPVSCKVQDLGGTSSTEETVFLHIDGTPPAVTVATPDRSTDSGGWWNHAVGYTFSGSDATSGLASCAPVTFDGPGTQLVGTCWDNAGNVGTGSFSIPFDATPPALRGVKASAGNRSATISWQPSSDTVRSQVVRAPGTRGQRSSTVYRGRGKRFHDASLTNGVTYRYTVTAFDQAGNGTSMVKAARPAASKGLKPPRGTRLASGPRLRWPAVKGANYYNVQMYHGKRKVLTRWPAHAHLKVGRHWVFQGRHIRLAPGTYRWYVWPGYGSRAAHRYGSFIGQSSFIIVA